MGNRKHVVHVSEAITFSTLASRTAIINNTVIDGNRRNGLLMDYIKGQISFTGKTAGEGPIIVGFCSSDLLVNEVTEAFGADSQQVNDPNVSEQAHREVYPVWSIGHGMTSMIELRSWQKIKYSWRNVEEGKGISLFAFNADSGALTTGMTLSFDGVVIGEWGTD